MAHSFRTKYGQYKHDTVQVSTWLAETALRNGYTLSSAKHSNVPIGCGSIWLDGRAETQCKEKGETKGEGREGGSGW